MPTNERCGIEPSYALFVYNFLASLSRYINKIFSGKTTNQLTSTDEYISVSPKIFAHEKLQNKKLISLFFVKFVIRILFINH